MPWSEWQAPFYVGLSGAVAWISRRDAGDVHEVIEVVPPDGVAFGESRGADGIRDTSSIQFSANPNWDVYRQKYPPSLDGLEEGVGYDVIPGKNRGDDDAYAEYDPDGYNDWQGWRDDGAPRQLTVGGVSYDVGGGWSATASLGIALETGYPTEVGSLVVAAAPQNNIDWAVETAVGGNGQGVEVFDVGTMPDPGNVTTFTLQIEAVPQGDLTSSGSGQMLFFRPVQRVLLPRYRYWIPELALPLRQKQRNDGLARGVLRARSTSSIQNSVRQNSYR